MPNTTRLRSGFSLPRSKPKSFPQVLQSWQQRLEGLQVVSQSRKISLQGSQEGGGNVQQQLQKAEVAALSRTNARWYEPLPPLPSPEPLVRVPRRQAPQRGGEQTEGARGPACQGAAAS